MSATAIANSVPSESTIRNVLIRDDPTALDLAFQQWNAQYGKIDESLAIDGKTMCNAIDKNGRQVNIMGVVGHQSKQSYTKKSRHPARKKERREKTDKRNQNLNPAPGLLGYSE